MATYFSESSSEMEAGAAAADNGSLQTLILMNPNSYHHHHHHHHHNLGSFSSSDTGQQPHHQPNNLVILNSVPAAAAGNTHPLNSHEPPNPTPHHQLVGIPLTQDPSHHDNIPPLHGFMPRFHYNLYTGAIEPAREVTRSLQGALSLSLSAQTVSSGRGGGPGGGGEELRVSGESPASGLSNGVNPGVNGVRNNAGLSSNYLKAAQELLDEVVTVGKASVKAESSKGSKVAGESSLALAGEAEGGAKRGGGGDMSAAERQEIQMRKAKLVAMLDEVEQRYRKYHHQMQMVISWFEQATGIGSAKTYTALALQTISRQFRCLKDAISGQIRASSKSLGEEYSLGGAGKDKGSRLRFVDHQIRQQRALQQLGMIQPNAWRPQRGLPERSVSVLRAWLFEHFLHPYPKDSDKMMLAKQTGLTRSQVSNWFINARVRLWKPMVEEMYTEEIKEQQRNGSEEKTTKSENKHEDPSLKIAPQQEKTPVIENQNMSFKSILDVPMNQNSPAVISASTTPTGVNFDLIGSSPDMEGITEESPKEQRHLGMLQSPNSYIPNEHMSIKFGDERQNRENFTLLGGPANFIGGLGTYPISEIRRYGTEQFAATYSGNGVSLTLGLPHCENLSLSGAHQSFLQNQNIQMGRRLEINEPDEFATLNSSTPSHSSAAYESINIQNRKRFAAQLLPDFVT